MGATAQPKTQPAEADTTHTVILEGERLWIAEEAAAHTQNVDVELGLSWALPQSLNPEVHVKIVVVEPDPKLGEPDAPRAAAYVQLVSVELDLLLGLPGDPKEDTCVHLTSAEPNDLQTKRDKDCLLEVEREETAVNAAVKEDVDPHVNLQGNGVSHLTTLKEDIFLTFSLSPLHNTLEAARMQCSPSVDAGMPAIEEPESTSCADMALLPLDTPPPKEATEPPKLPSPEQIQAPINAEGLLESP